MEVRLTSGVVPNQLPADIIGAGVLIVPNAVALLEGDRAQRISKAAGLQEKTVSFLIINLVP